MTTSNCPQHYFLDLGEMVYAIHPYLSGYLLSQISSFKLSAERVQLMLDFLKKIRIFSSLEVIAAPYISIFLKYY